MRYWPDEGSMDCGCVVVSKDSESATTDYILREFTVHKKPKEEQEKVIFTNVQFLIVYVNINI